MNEYTEMIMMGMSTEEIMEQAGISKAEMKTQMSYDEFMVMVLLADANKEAD